MMTIRTYMRGVAGDDEDREDSRRLIFVGKMKQSDYLYQAL